MSEPSAEDPFDDVLRFEERTAVEGRSLGQADGARNGFARGRSLGQPQGASIGAELGYMTAMARILADEEARVAAERGAIAAGDDDGSSGPPRRARVVRLGLELVQLVAEIPLENPKTEEAAEGVQRARARFKLISALARLPQTLRSPPAP